MVGEAQHAEALVRQPRVPTSVVFVVMERPVVLHDQSVAETDEVHDVGAERDLTAALQALQPTITQELPEEPFG